MTSMQRPRPVKRITIVIPSLHRPDLTARCIAAITQQTLPAEQYETLVVENEARADSILPSPLPPNVRQILLEKNYGTTGSINRGIVASASEYVLLLNNDVELDPGFLAALLTGIDSNPRYGFVTGKLLRAMDRSRFDGAGDAMLMGGGAYRLGHFDLDTGQFDQARLVLSGCGAATLFRRSVFDEIQGLDEDFFAYLDDLDLSLRAQLTGYQGAYIPSAVAYHIGSGTLGDPFHPRIVSWLTRNQILLLAKDFPAPVLFALTLRVLGFQLLWFTFVARRGALGAYAKGLIQALLLLPRMLRKRQHTMRSRKISNAEFRSLLAASEAQIFDWHTRRQEDRSHLLDIYFRWFGRPRIHT
jgi:GT2 family glycosyltransferase